MTTVAAAAPTAAPVPPAAPLGAVRLAMLAFRAETGCSQFDYFPGGGMQNLWCHRPLDFAFSALEGDAKVPVFASGPHGHDVLKLDERNDFGHYNPAFVRWVKDSVVPARDDEFRLRSQPAYDSAASKLVTVFWHVRKKIDANRACFDRETAAYGAAVAAHTLPAGYYERWFHFMNPSFCEREAAQTARAMRSHPKSTATALPPEPDSGWYYGHHSDSDVDGNVTKTVVGFWVRRTLDGTEGAFTALLDKVVASYQPDLVKETTLPAPQLTVPPRAPRKPTGF